MTLARRLPCEGAPWPCAQSQSPPTAPVPGHGCESHRAAVRQSAGSQKCERPARTENSSSLPHSTPAAASPSSPSGRNRRAPRATDPHIVPPAPPSSSPLVNCGSKYIFLFGSGYAGLGHLHSAVCAATLTRAHHERAQQGSCGSFHLTRNAKERRAMDDTATVFIVDDEVRMGLSRLLAIAGYHVRAFESAE